MTNRSLTITCVTILLAAAPGFARGKFERTSPYRGLYGVVNFNPVVGISAIRTIKLQISFRYLADDREDIDVFFGYTMRSFWAIDQGSHPFKELVFNPEAWVQWSAKDSEDTEWRAGIEHESNGLAGAESRGWNKIYIEASDGWRSDSENWSSRHALKLWRAFMVSSKTAHMVEHHAVFGNFGYDATADLVEEGAFKNVPGRFIGSVRVKKWPIPTEKRPGFLEFDLRSRWKNAFWHAQIFRGYGERLIPSKTNHPLIYPKDGYRRLKPKLGLRLLQ